MKTYCKPKLVDIESESFNMPATLDAFRRKTRRSDHKKLLINTGLVTECDIATAYLTKDDSLILKAKRVVNADITNRIRNRDLKLKPIRQFERIDGLTHKKRSICQESVEQQIMEYIAVNALQDLFKRKLLHCQYGSVPGRGQVAGKRKIERILRRKHTEKLTVIKCDIKKAYPSVTTECVMRLLRRDIGKNKTLLWFLNELIGNYPDGHLCIGGYLSSWLFNYTMSYFLRHLQSHSQSRRDKTSKLVTAVVCYADDFAVFGQKSKLIKALKKTVKWAKTILGLQVKSAWQVYHMSNFETEKSIKAQRSHGSKKRTNGVDMMGYTVYRTYTIIRKRVYKRMKRQFLRAWKDIKKYGYLPYFRARKLISYKGWIKNSNSKKVIETYQLDDLFTICGQVISKISRKEKNDYDQGMLQIATIGD